ncbi:Flp pilus assembly protein CpaB [Paenalcaligenes niemegkensis]|uniref:Flp pilus assembly protein CpaB n=1 Tax=Paenalcaligenes niemegkensis TaxID=2895469 RepID=UPI001EE80F1C|nr:Flp pilus assembly protein CpaB [Paenalcaligenes niemegkensis]MCQ9616992.1 Flp pilus assembly protein CpaB [Paenalcaligenes niemegkensis]
MTRFMKIAAIVLSVLALILILLAIKLIFAPAPQPERVVVREASTEEPVEAIVVPTYPVLVAVRDMQAGAEVTALDVDIAQWPIQPQHSLPDAESAIGEYLRLDIAEGEPILRPVFKRGIAEYLGANERALTIPVDEQVGAAHRIQPGDHVDVFFTLERTNEIGHTQSRLLLPAARVLAYGGDSVDGPAAPAGQARAGQSEAAARHAMLAVPLAQVNELLMATRKGRLQLVLRAASDVAMPEPELFDAYKPLRDARSGLSTAQKEQLNTPENLAYAGLSLEEVAVSDEAVEAPVVRQTGSAAVRRVQVIRSGKVSDESY